MNKSSCQKAHEMLKTDNDIKQRWSQAVRWLHEQLEVIKMLFINFILFFFYFFSGLIIMYNQIIIIIHHKYQLLAMICHKGKIL